MGTQLSLLPPSAAASPPAARGWIAVASAEHVAIGRAGGFMQVCHGKAAPLRRLRPGDRVAYYSPTGRFGGGDKLQAFTALGTLLAGGPYQADMGGGFVPWRRDVAWWPAARAAAPIAPLLPLLSFSAGQRHWGQRLRFGLFEVPLADLDLIAQALGAWPEPAVSAA